MKNKVKFAIVTGASTGIGQAISLELAKEGVFVVSVARDYDKLIKTKEIIKKAGGKAEINATDLCNLKSVDRLLAEIKAKTDKVDIVANVAGIWHGRNEVYADKDFEKFSREVVLDTMMVGIVTPMLLVHRLLPLMSKGGKILNISGTFENGAKGWLPYYVSKKAIEDFTVGLSEDLKGKGIQVNCISPSDTKTEAYEKYFPQYIKDAIEPKEIAKYAAYLCSSKADNFTGEVFVMKKGKKPYKSYHS